MKKNEGFTMVELIVVIAILGIMAAVAIPAYSGYITKANEAADQQLVSEINTAIAAAAAGSGLTASDVTAAGSISSGTATITISYSTNTTTQTAVQKDLATFLGASSYNSGVSVSGFKHYKSFDRGSDGLLTGKT